MTLSETHKTVSEIVADATTALGSITGDHLLGNALTRRLDRAVNDLLDVIEQHGGIDLARSSVST